MDTDYKYEPKNGLTRWLDSRLPLMRFTSEHVLQFPTPKNLNYFWTFGFILTMCLVTQIITGIILAMHYAPSTLLAFDSVEHIMRNVNYGWLIRYIHSNGASMFFLAVFIHMFRGLYYGSYKEPREVIWILGCIIYLLMIVTAFMGYVLPWRQNSYIDLVGSYLKDKGLKKINISADIESQLSLLEISEQKEFLNTMGLEEPGLNKLIIEGYKALKLITFFTSGPKETKAWTIKKGSLAPQAAGKIHTDFEKGFIRAETISYNELNSIGNFIEAKDSGKLRSEGKEYIVKDGDIMNFRFNV